MKNYLFYKGGSLRDFLESQKKGIKGEIYKFREDYILNVNEQDFINAIVNKYTLRPPILEKGSIYTLEPEEVNVDVSHDSLRDIIDRSRPHYIKGTSITIIIPFNGDEVLFYYRPSTFTTILPKGEIRDSEIYLSYTTVNHNNEIIKNSYKGDLANIQKHLEWVKNDVEQYNQSLNEYIKNIFIKRKQKLLKDRDLVSSLNIPIKKRENNSSTYSIPLQPKEIRVKFPQVKAEKFEPEPTLTMNIYDDILNIIQDMAVVIERSPKAFTRMGEENLRDHFLVQLNGQYKGQGMAEVFNYQGRTDILVRWENRNVFIAECKFWRGAKKFLETVDQLLRYVTWRDTKTAILIFNRNCELSKVLEEISKNIKLHPCYKKDIKKINETTFCYTLHLPNDLNREIILTILVFDIPKK